MDIRRLKLDLSEYQSLPGIETEQIIKLGEELLIHLVESSHQSEKAVVYSRIGGAYIARGDYESAFRAFSQSRQIHNDMHDQAGALRDQLAFGVIYSFSEQPETAFDAFLAIRDKARSLALLDIEEMAHYHMGRICNHLNRFEEGLEFLGTAHRMVERTGNKNHKAGILHEIGKIALNQGHLEEATPYLEEANRIVSGEKEILTYEILISLGELYSRLSQHKEALACLNRSLELYQGKKIRHGEIQTLYHLGNLFNQIGELEKAVEAWERCYTLSGPLWFRGYRISSGECLIEYYRNTGEYELALDMLEKIRKEERNDRNDRLHHTISIYDQSTRIEDLSQEIQAWKYRSRELEKIQSDKEEYIRELETIGETGQELTASLIPDCMIEVLHNRLTQLVTVDKMIIAFYLPENETMDIRYILENGHHLPPVSIPVRENEDLTSWAVKHHQDLLINSMEERSKFVTHVHNSSDTGIINESHLVVCLKIGGQIIGVLSVQARKKRSYKERHLKVLQALTGFIAIALSNSSAHHNLIMASKQINYMATHDSLTGLPNRMNIINRLEQEIIRGKRYGKSFAVLFIDIDGFKEVNDTFGHHAGDFVLKTVAKRLSSGTRAADAVGRLAGDEFLVVFSDDCTQRVGYRLAEKIRKNLSEKMPFEEASLEVTGSLGLAFYPEDGNTSETLVNAADEAMYKAKTEGKNRTASYSTFAVKRFLPHFEI